MSQPSIGRIVYVSNAHVPNTVYPAIVTAVEDDHGTISCTVFPPSSDPLPLQHVRHSDPTPGRTTWAWPEIKR